MNTLNISIILIISIYIIICYSPLGVYVPKNKNLNKIFNNNIFKIFILYLMIVICNTNLTLSLLIGIAYIITIQNNLKELFNNCLRGSRITACPSGQGLINIHGLNPFCGNPNINID